MRPLAQKSGGVVSDQGGEFNFDPEDFERIRKLIHDRAGINLHAGKQAMVYSRISRRLRERGEQSFNKYLKWLEAARGVEADAEWQEFVNCLTTNLTSFFREDHHFRLLATELSKRRGRPTRIWCNAASTGEEPYSLAITVAETLGTNADVNILCSDIDTKVLSKAAAGIYAADTRGLSTDHMHRYFLKGTGSNHGLIRAQANVRKFVEFKQVNLMDAQWSLGNFFDFVFCRNVMIYFNQKTQREVLEKTHRAMAAGGLLFAGHSENFAESRDLFRMRGKTVYERIG